MVLKLYAGARVSGGSAVVALVLALKKIPYEYILVDMANKENKSAEHLKRHPYGQIPVLDDDGFILYETRAICKYLENKFPGQGMRLAPAMTDVKGQALFDQAASVEVADFYRPMLKVVQEVVFNKMMGRPTNQANLDDGLKDFGSKLDVYEQLLAKQKYTAGNELSLVDLYHLTYAPSLEPAGVNILQSESRPNVKRWWNELIGLPAWVQLKGEGYKHVAGLAAGTTTGV
uniref:glutathione transferase n=1 Tax=Mycena chlorophos TaxID=658473 RepID=A0ABQ0MDA0_MYCCL|nr:glutathione S-transferase [Mycena chlorophos]